MVAWLKVVGTKISIPNYINQLIVPPLQHEQRIQHRTSNLLGAENVGQFSATDNINKGPTLLGIKNSDHGGLFVTVEICHIPIHSLIATDSTMSVINTKIFRVTKTYSK